MALFDEIIKYRDKLSNNYSNVNRFSNNIFEPREIIYNDEKYILFLARFKNLHDLYDYLKSNPRINKQVFTKLSSLSNDSDFAGKPYNQAVEDLICSTDPGYDEFLKLQGFINKAVKMDVHKYKTIKTVSGGRLNIPSYSAGVPLCYETEEKILKPKFIKIHISLSYNWTTSKKQVYNRAIIITNIIKALESAGYNVDANTFELASNSNEFIYISVDVKRHGERINMQALYKSLCHVEFLRRILFRVLETLDVKSDWNYGYGSTCGEKTVRKVLKLNENDIFFDQPGRMGIRGNDLSSDFESAIKYLGLSDNIDVESAKKKFSEQSKKLLLRK